MLCEVERGLCTGRANDPTDMAINRSATGVGNRVVRPSFRRGRFTFLEGREKKMFPLRIYKKQNNMEYLL